MEEFRANLKRLNCHGMLKLACEDVLKTFTTEFNTRPNVSESLNTFFVSKFSILDVSGSSHPNICKNNV